MNARYLDEVRERNPALLGDMLEEAATDFLAAVARLPADRLFLFPEVGVEVTPEAALSIEAGELLVHGFDIAKAVGRRWEIAASEAVLVIDGVMHLMPDYLDRGAASGVRASYELRIRGGRRYVVTIEDGVMSVGPPGKQVDCWISADPVTLLLVSYGRIGQWGPAFRGKILAGGRRPWLALRFKRYLTKI